MTEAVAAESSSAMRLQTLLRVADARRLGAMMLTEDPAFGGVCRGRAASLVDAALIEGLSRAESVARVYGPSPRTIASMLGLTVIESDDDADFGSVTVFAEYVARAQRITLFGPALGRIDRLLQEPVVHRLLGVSSCVPIFLAHELYHHFDHVQPNGPLSCQHQTVVIKIGRWCWYSPLMSLDEIAAGAFAQGLLGLSFHPKLLELLLLPSERMADLAHVLASEAVA